jgi:hypothetical protein
VSVISQELSGMLVTPRWPGDSHSARARRCQIRLTACSCLEVGSSKLPAIIGEN